MLPVARERLAKPARAWLLGHAAQGRSNQLSVSCSNRRRGCQFKCLHQFAHICSQFAQKLQPICSTQLSNVCAVACSTQFHTETLNIAAKGMSVELMQTGEPTVAAAVHIRLAWSCASAQTGCYVSLHVTSLQHDTHCHATAVTTAKRRVHRRWLCDRLLCASAAAAGPQRVSHD